MKPYIKMLGGIIETQAASAPERARDILTAAYSWVRFSGKLKFGKNLCAAYDYLNGAAAGMIVDSFRHPKDSVMVNIFFPCELLHAMGLHPMFPEGISIYAACTACQQTFAETAEAFDVPESFCSYHKTMLGMAESGVMPAPLMIAHTTLACDANQLSFRRMADLYDVPRTVIDVPHETSGEAVAYGADQLRALTPQLEDLCHCKLNEQTLKAAIARSRRTIETYQGFLRLRGEISLPVTMTGELCSVIANHVMLGRPESERYADRLLCAAQTAPKKTQEKNVFFGCTPSQIGRIP